MGRMLADEALDPVLVPESASDSTPQGRALRDISSRWRERWLERAYLPGSNVSKHKTHCISFSSPNP
jgi:hypothetical protein